ncbi:MAG: heat shock protein HslJ [Paraglaciecola sp.]|jgi:heat shock protein HslJ
MIKFFIQYTLVEMVEKKQDTKLRINDIWAVQSILGTPFKITTESPRVKRPMLEVHIADKKILGNDGCNQFFGKLERLTDTKIQFGAVGGTKMACPDMESSNNFNDALGQVARYKISDLKLYLFKENGEEVLVFQKVD